MFRWKLRHIYKYTHTCTTWTIFTFFCSGIKCKVMCTKVMIGSLWHGKKGPKWWNVYSYTQIRRVTAKIMWHIKIGSMLIQHIIIKLLLIHTCILFNWFQPHSFDQLCANSKLLAICIISCDVFYLSSVRFWIHSLFY